MEGATPLLTQVKGPFAKRNLFNPVVVAVNAFLNMKTTGGGKLVYGDNGVTLDLSGLGGVGGGVEVTVTGALNGQPASGVAFYKTAPTVI